MRYKCHYCSELLKPGINYTLECECGNCNLGFDRTGKVDQFKVTFFEKGKDIFLLKDRNQFNSKIVYGFKHPYIKPDNNSGINPYTDKVVMQVDVDLQFDKENVPQVYTLWEKLDKLKAFS